MALTHSDMVPLRTHAPNFNLPDVHGKYYSLGDFKAAQAITVVFMCNHCPYVIAVLDRLIDLQNQYKEKGIQFIGINPNDAKRYPDDSPEAMKKLLEKKNIPFPYLIDCSQETARAYNALCTPDIFVYGVERTLLYRGRIDDNWQEPKQVKREDLKIALDLILTGKNVFKEQVPSMGCSIKWKA